ncbi:hypothetical protein EJ06DRAFT_60982 [Trichodelitschia bisporula]|uniref:Uncharacterized protein n=1 Tax=Trichodelitschia bisporula TaxID=703511 RepID=A0A6G1HUA3_9PEZI|nr:hypothetical protein EJ06DRAFT_60982 [Trichodelitschia bisporula]
MQMLAGCSCTCFVAGFFYDVVMFPFQGGGGGLGGVIGEDVIRCGVDLRWYILLWGVGAIRRAIHWRGRRGERRRGNMGKQCGIFMRLCRAVLAIGVN